MDKDDKLLRDRILDPRQLDIFHYCDDVIINDHKLKKLSEIDDEIDKLESSFEALMNELVVM